MPLQHMGTQIAVPGGLRGHEPWFQWARPPGSGPTEALGDRPPLHHWRLSGEPRRGSNRPVAGLLRPPVGCLRRGAQWAVQSGHGATWVLSSTLRHWPLPGAHRLRGNGPVSDLLRPSVGCLRQGARWLLLALIPHGTDARHQDTKAFHILTCGQATNM